MCNKNLIELFALRILIIKNYYVPIFPRFIIWQTPKQGHGRVAFCQQIFQEIQI